MIDRDWVTVFEKDQAVVGFIARDQAYVHALYVAETMRGQGVGSALLRNAKAGSDHLDLWTFQANLHAQKFYLGAGFSETERTDGQGNDEKLPDIRYQWQRAAA
jgi:ribosomal protein S18 acetylase RimI-like enzyme